MDIRKYFRDWRESSEIRNNLRKTLNKIEKTPYRNIGQANSLAKGLYEAIQKAEEFNKRTSCRKINTRWHNFTLIDFEQNIEDCWLLGYLPIK